MSFEVRRKVHLMMLWQSGAYPPNKTDLSTSPQVRSSLSSQEFLICPLASVRVLAILSRLLSGRGPGMGTFGVR